MKLLLRPPPRYSALLVTLVGGSLLAAPASAEPLPGDSCAGSPTGALHRSGGPELLGAGHELVCDSGTWKAIYSHLPSGVFVPSLIDPGDCGDGDPLAFDDATNAMRCGSGDSTAPVWVTPAGVLQAVDVRQELNRAVAATDELGSPTYQKISGPLWLAVARTGLVSGAAPAEHGSYNFTVRARDAAGNTADRTFQIVVNDPDGPSDCPLPGDLCLDGTIYAGKTPDGGVDFFITQSDSPAALPFNDGSTDYLDTGLANCNGVSVTCRSGEYNTNVLALSDSSSASGFQPHEAALWCYCLGEEHAEAPDATAPAPCVGSDAAAAEGHGFDDWYLPAIAEMDRVYSSLICPEDPDNPASIHGGFEGGLSCPGGFRPNPAGFGGTRGYNSSSELNAAQRQIVRGGTSDSGQMDHWGGWAPKQHLNWVRCSRKR